LKLLDSNTVIHYLQGREPLVSRLHAASPQEIQVPSVVAYELAYGTLKSGTARRRVVMEKLLHAFAQAPFDAAAALEAARIRVDLDSRGLRIGPLELMIAATATSTGAILITNNTKEFSRVAGLRLEDWTRSLGAS
jgi:tRNA(fMet)-specific endonuclease VapC